MVTVDVIYRTAPHNPTENSVDLRKTSLDVEGDDRGEEWIEGVVTAQPTQRGGY
jgi:hypothetical protein